MRRVDLAEIIISTQPDLPKEVKKKYLKLKIKIKEQFLSMFRDDTKLDIDDFWYERYKIKGTYYFILIIFQLF